MSLRDKYTDEEWDHLEKNSSKRDFSPGWTERQKNILKKSTKIQIRIVYMIHVLNV